MEKIGLKAVWDNADFQKGYHEYLNSLNKAESATGNVAVAMTSGGLGAGVIALGTALGNLAVGAISTVTSGLWNMASGAVEAVSAFQKLEMGLQSLAAREMVAVGQAENIGSAFDDAKPRAEAMLMALREVSLASPFEYQDIAKVFQMSLAFGQGSKTALELSEAITNIAAVSPLASGQLLERIAYNFNQMSLTGKITARDIRDLAMAGVNFADVLRSQLSMSVEQANKALESGAITMRDVTQAFIQYAETNFGGAAERLATQTLPGLTSSFKDLAFFASQEVFGGAIETVTKFLSKIYDKANALLQSGVLQRIGAILKVLAEYATRFLARIFNIDLSDTVTQAKTTVQDVTEQAISDIAETASTAAAKALPPVFQGIGLDTATAWLQGFSQGDFDMLSAISAPLSGLSNYLASSMGMSGDEAARNFANFFADITQAISGGNLEGAFGKIVSQFGSAGQAVVDLAKANMAVADSTKAVEDAEKRLADARKARETANAKANRLVREYNELLRNGADASSEAMKAKLREINAAYAEQDAADKAIESAEDDLEAKKEADKLAKDQLKTQQALVQALLQFAQTQTSAMTKTANATDDNAESLENLSTLAESDIFEPLSEGADKFAGIEESVRQKLDAIIATLQEKFVPAWERVQGVATKVYDWFMGETASLTAYLQDWWTKHGDSIITIWEYIKDKAIEIWGKISPYMGEVISNGWELTKKILANIGEEIGLTIDIISLILQGKWSEVGEKLQEIFQLNMENLGLLLANQVDFWLQLLRMVFGEEIYNTVIEFWTKQFPLLKDKALEKIENLKDLVTASFGGLKENLYDIFEDIRDRISNSIDRIKDKISDIWHFLYDFVGNPIEYLRSGFDNIATAIGTVGWWFGHLREVISNIWHFIYDFIDNPLTALWNSLSGLFGGTSFGMSSPSGGATSFTPSTTGSTSVSSVTTATTPVAVTVNVGTVNNGMSVSALTGLITNTINGMLAI